MVSFHRLFCISVVGQIVLLTLFGLQAPTRASIGTIAVGVAVLLQAVNALLLVVTAMRRTPPPWKVLRWLFTVAGLVFAVCAFGEVFRTLGRGDVIGFVMLAAMCLMPGLCQIALLWWPERVVAEQQEAEPEAEEA